MIQNWIVFEHPMPEMGFHLVWQDHYQNAGAVELNSCFILGYVWKIMLGNNMSYFAKYKWKHEVILWGSLRMWGAPIHSLN